MSRHVGQGPQAAPGTGIGRDPFVHLRGLGMGWGGSGAALTPPRPCPGTRSQQTEMPITPSLMGTCRVGGHPPRSVPAALRPGTLQGPGSHPSRVRALLSEPQDGDQPRVSRAAGVATVSRSRAGREGSPGQLCQRGWARGTTHSPAHPAQCWGAHGLWDGCWQRAGWGAQRADAGRYDRSICWLLVCLLFNFFLIQSYIAVGGAGIIATLPECS